jgi:hypothetical protein
MVMLASCVSIPYSKTGNDIDYSYPVHGALLENRSVSVLIFCKERCIIIRFNGRKFKAAMGIR